ncbi:MAG: nickel pincer cofactor biosynthesis protein LarC [Acidimicrobiales bacterium]
MSTAAWFHCFSGIAGDMALGALIDAGADVGEVRALLDRLPMAGWSMEVEPVMRGGIGATKVEVVVADTPVVRTYAHITGLIVEARLPERVANRAQAIFAALADAEGHLHRRPVAQVHFHEVGGVDAVIDVVGACAALEVLGVDTVWSSPVANGMGMVRSAHGMLPVPAPAVVELLRGAPSYGRDVPYELTTPTGAAILAATATGWGPMPAMRVGASGFGAGTRDLEGLPNLLQVVVGEALAAEPARPEPGQPVTLLEVNVDDATGETLAHAVAALMDAGALDAWLTPILMKKGRPAYTFSVLADQALADQLAGVLVAETGSLGVRGETLERWAAARTQGQVDVDGIPVRVKVGAGRVKVEHDDAARAARRTGLPLREVVSRAEEAWRRRGDGDGDGDGDESA